MIDDGASEKTRERGDTFNGGLQCGAGSGGGGRTMGRASYGATIYGAICPMSPLELFTKRPTTAWEACATYLRRAASCQPKARWGVGVVCAPRDIDINEDKLWKIVKKYCMCS